MSKEVKKPVTAAAEGETADVENAEGTEGAEADTNEGEGAEGTAEGAEGAEGESTENTDNTIDFDKEIDAENKRGTPDPSKAGEAFKKRDKKRKGDTDAEDATEGEEDDDRPITAKDLKNVRAEMRREVLGEQALQIAKGLTRTSANPAKEAELIVAKWRNRTFPEGLPIHEQIEECYAIVHRKRLAGERDEAIRALRNKDSVRNKGTGAQREPAQGSEPKLSPGDAQALKGAGYAFNGVTRRWEKKLKNGDVLYRDPKTKQTVIVKKSQS